MIPHILLENEYYYLTQHKFMKGTTN